jgi:site-specific DNA-methyltransferase (adenine-specific)
MIYNGLLKTNTLLADNEGSANELRQYIVDALQKDSIIILPPMEVKDSLAMMAWINLSFACTMLDPWYNKGVGGTMPLVEYDRFINGLLADSARISNHIFLWGFPEIIGPYVRYAPKGFSMNAWLTWYYKNCPSVIRGWRSSQNACIHFSRDKFAMFHPENFLNTEQLERFITGKMRFVPGPSSVIEEPLIIGFVGKKERTGHPAQKPEKVFDRLIQMATTEGEVIFDPMAGSGTTAAVAIKTGRKAIVCDSSPEYISMIEERLGIAQLSI